MKGNIFKSLSLKSKRTTINLRRKIILCYETGKKQKEKPINLNKPKQISFGEIKE